MSILQLKTLKRMERRLGKLLQQDYDLENPVEKRLLIGIENNYYHTQEILNQLRKEM